MRKLLPWFLAASLAGCGNSGDGTFTTGGGLAPAPVAGPNTLRLVDETPDLSVNGESVTVVTATGYDASGQLLFGPIEAPYDSDVSYTDLPEATRRVELDFERGAGYPLAHYTADVNFATDDDNQIVIRDASATFVARSKTFEVRIVNKSFATVPDDQVYLCVLGTDDPQTRWNYLKFSYNATTGVEDNQLTPFGLATDFKNYSFKLSGLKVIDKEKHIYAFECPYEVKQLYSGRIYLSFGKQLQDLGLLKADEPKVLRLPSAAAGAKDEKTLFEFMELSATSQPNAPSVYTVFSNTSVVDFFSIGLNMEMFFTENGSERSEAVGFVDDARNKVLAEIKKTDVPEVFRNADAFIKNDLGQDVRLLSPSQIVGRHPSSGISTFLQKSIDEGWEQYKKTVLNFPDNLGERRYGFKFTGQLIGANDLLPMTCTEVPINLSKLGEVCNLFRPNSRIVWLCDDDVSPRPIPAPSPGVTPIEDKDSWRNLGSDSHKRLCSLLSAAMTRGVFGTYADWATPGKFYTREDKLYSWYAKVLHKFAVDSKVYAFPYDDIYGQDPTIAKPLDSVNRMILTIPPITGLTVTQ